MLFRMGVHVVRHVNIREGRYGGWPSTGIHCGLQWIVWSEALSSHDLSEFIAEKLADSHSNQPLYHQLVIALQQGFEEGVLVRGSFLPSERDMAKSLSISRVTMRRAIDELVKDGLLVRRHGSKTMVARRYEKTISNLTGFSEDSLARGQIPGAIWISKKIVAPSSTEAMALNLSLQDQVIRMERLRTADGKPLAIERATIPKAFLPSPDLVHDSLYDALEKLGVLPSEGVQRLRAGVMNKEDAQLLESEVGAPLLIMERCCFLPDGRAVEVTQTRYKGDSYEFLTQLKR